MDYNINENGVEILIETCQRNTRSEIISQFVACRKEKNLTQENLSELTGIARSNIARFESGNYNPTLDMMVRIATAMDMKINIKLEKKTS